MVVGFGCWLWWLWCVVVGGLVGGGSCACRVPVTQVALCERRAGALSERKKKSPNPMNSKGIGDIHGPKPYEFTWFGDIHGPKPYEYK